MGNTCCETIPGHTIIDSLNNLTQFADYEPSHFPSEDSYFLEHVQSQNQEELKENSYKHKYQNRYFIGDWNNGMPNGKGIYYDPNIILYNGQFHEGAFSGHAEVDLIKKNCHYSGNIENGRAKNKGTLRNFEEKYKFQGQWEDSQPSQGILQFESNQQISTIQFHPHKNIINYHDKKKYQGQINKENFLPEGVGRLSFAPESEKDYYEGSWYNGKMDGKGRYFWKDGSSYEGQYVKGKKQGFGNFNFKTKNVYQGQWKNGKQEGIGILKDKVGAQLKKGKWQEGKFVKGLGNQEYEKEKYLLGPAFEKIEQNIESKDEVFISENQIKEAEEAKKSKESDRNIKQSKVQIKQVSNNNEDNEKGSQRQNILKQNSQRNEEDQKEQKKSNKEEEKQKQSKKEDKSQKGSERPNNEEKEKSVKEEGSNKKQENENKNDDSKLQKKENEMK